MDSYYTLTKEHLKNYKFYLTSLEQKKKRLSFLYGGNCPSGISNIATDYSSDKAVSSPVHDFTDEIASEILKLSVQISSLETLIDDINEGLKKLEPLTKRILTMKYINCWDKNYSWSKLQVELNLEINEKKKRGEELDYISEKTVRRRATKGISQISIVLYGVVKPINKKVS